MLVLAALFLKAAVVPFHAWAPDAYEGASIPVTAYMATVIKAGVLLAALRIFDVAPVARPMVDLLAILPLVSMAWGNLAAIRQTSSELSGLMAQVARVAIIALVMAMGLRAMGIADDIVNLGFAFTFGAVAVAVALSFGLGGREAAGRQLEYWFSKLRQPESRPPEQAGPG